MYTVRKRSMSKHKKKKNDMHTRVSRAAHINIYYGKNRSIIDTTNGRNCRGLFHFPVQMINSIKLLK